MRSDCSRHWRLAPLRRMGSWPWHKTRLRPHANGAPSCRRKADCDAFDNSLRHGRFRGLRKQAGDESAGRRGQRSAIGKMKTRHSSYKRRPRAYSSGWRARKLPPVRISICKARPRRGPSAKIRLFFNDLKQVTAEIERCESHAGREPGGFPLVEGGKIIGAIVGTAKGRSFSFSLFSTGDQDGGHLQVGCRTS